MSIQSLTEPQQWLKKYGDALFRYALLRVGNRETAEDLLQETLLSAWRGHDRFAGQSSEKTWLTGILKHKIADHYRKRERQGKQENLDAVVQQQDAQFDERGHWVNYPDDWQAPDRDIDSEQLRHTLQRCIEALPERLADAFVLSEFGNLGNEELCKVLDISTTNNLWVMLSRARQRLRDCLDRHWFKPHGEN